MTTYYWETEDVSKLHNSIEFGELQANSDKEAINKMPPNCILLYKEKDTINGSEFVVVYDMTQKKEII